MELPSELWSSILLKTRSIQSCNKLYTALPRQTRDELKKTYDSHKERLNIKIFCGFQNKLTVYSTCNNDNLDFEFQLDNIFAVQYIKNWDTSIGKKDCIISATKTGLVMFWDANTMEYIQGMEFGSNICEIEFHPTKSILLIVGRKLTFLELKIWKFDKYWSIIRISIDFIGNNKKYYYFHPTDPDVYIFSSSCSRKISKMYIYNYDARFPSITNRIQNDYYVPLKINEDGSFECIKYDGTANYFCNFIISDFEIEEIKLQTVRFPQSSLVILDFLRIGEDIYFHTNHSDDTTIYKQTGDEYKIIYKTTNKISKLFNKKNFLVFFENEECKCVDLDSFEIDRISIGEIPVDFCVM
jgi:hypothetical protein